jgi:hypothetical protein
MDWIKKHTDQFALAVLAFLLLAFSALIILRSTSFGEKFSALESRPPRKDTLPEVPVATIATAQQSIDKPGQWTPKAPPGAKEPGSLFASDQYYVREDGRLIKITEDQDPFGIPTGWLLKYNLDPYSRNTVTDDPDRDGFNNLEEYRGASRAVESNPPSAAGDPDTTNPIDAQSHPPYHTLLTLKQYIPVRFRLVFASYNGDPKKPETLDFQINTLDRTGPTEFYKLGGMLAGTKFKIEKFEFKTQVNPATKADEDVSELTLVNIESGDVLVLPLYKVVNSPDSEGIFHYGWPEPPEDMRLRKGQQFILKPVREPYKLIDIKETEAVIVLPTGEKYTVPFAR